MDAGDRLHAVRRAAEGTGLALVGSALSSVVGFLILALAPMPLFASYGLLTAVMITLALTATLLVLPSLLVAVTRDTARVPTPIEDLVPALIGSRPIAIHQGPAQNNQPHPQIQPPPTTLTKKKAMINPRNPHTATRTGERP